MVKAEKWRQKAEIWIDLAQHSYAAETAEILRALATQALEYADELSLSARRKNLLANDERPDA